MNDTYKMSGKIGSCPYMAPEVYKQKVRCAVCNRLPCFQCRWSMSSIVSNLSSYCLVQKPYNEKVDVYGFALILWEILELKKAFIEYAHDKAVLAEKVFFKNERPPIRVDWPSKVQELLPKAWSVDMNDRPSMKEISIILKDTIGRLRGCDYSGLHEKPKREPKHILTGVRRLLHKSNKKPITTYS